jgi:hypothetical protein
VPVLLGAHPGAVVRSWTTGEELLVVAPPQEQCCTRVPYAVPDAVSSTHEPLFWLTTSNPAYSRTRLNSWAPVLLQVYCCSCTPLLVEEPGVSMHSPELSATKL